MLAFADDQPIKKKPGTQPAVSFFTGDIWQLCTVSRLLPLPIQTGGNRGNIQDAQETDEPQEEQEGRQIDRV